ncbi:MAG TPA: OmpH family outer membrane protein [Verrucomicrobiae bacterium]|nr:OmpH family outer membrane protein [Verrucomicrobiae bacterium]
MMLRTIVPAIAALALLGNTAMAQTKIATVDVAKLFKNYYKTKLAQADLDQRKAQIDQDESSMLADLKKGNTDYEQLLDDANNQALSADDRSAKQLAADAKLKELNDSKAALDQYDRSARANLADQVQRMHDKIVADIQAAVTTTAKSDGYTLVLDASAQSAANTPVLIYNSGDVDLTAQVLKQLNAGAPIDTTSATSSPSDSLLTAPPPLLSNPGSP